MYDLFNFGLLYWVGYVTNNLPQKKPKFMTKKQQKPLRLPIKIVAFTPTHYPKHPYKAHDYKLEWAVLVMT